MIICWITVVKKLGWPQQARQRNRKKETKRKEKSKIQWPLIPNQSESLSLYENVSGISLARNDSYCSHDH